MRRPNYTEEDHLLRTKMFWEAVQEHANLSLSLFEPWVNPYRDVPAEHLQDVEAAVKRGFLDALPGNGVPVLIAADDKTREGISYAFADKQKSRGSLVRLVAHDRRWFEENWNLFVGDLGLGRGRVVLVFLEFKAGTLAGLMKHWWALPGLACEKPLGFVDCAA